MASWLRLLPTCRSTSPATCSPGATRYAEFSGVVDYTWLTVSGTNSNGTVNITGTTNLGSLDYAFLQTGGGSFGTWISSSGSLAATPSGTGILAIDGFMWIAGDPAQINVSSVPSPPPSSCWASPPSGCWVTCGGGGAGRRLFATWRLLRRWCWSAFSRPMPRANHHAAGVHRGRDVCLPKRKVRGLRLIRPAFRLDQRARGRIPTAAKQHGRRSPRRMFRLRAETHLPAVVTRPISTTETARGPPPSLTTASLPRHPTRRISTSPFPTRNRIKPPARLATPTNS